MTKESMLLAGSRRASDVASRLKRTVATLYEASREAHSARNADAVWLVGYEAEQLLGTMLFEADTLVRLMNDDDDAFGDELERAARDLHHALRAQRLARKLSNVAGRTPEEAAAHLARAKELRK